MEAIETLRHAGTLSDEAVDLAEAALALAMLGRPGVDPAPYRAHLADLAREVGALAAGEAPLTARLSALQTVLVARHGYAGDVDSYDDLSNANIMHVIDRRAGLPVALGILFMVTARAQGWTMAGLNFPGHFLVRLELGNERVILDPFNRGLVRSVVELRDLLKIAAGAEAELTPEHYAPVGNRDILLRLQNNLKLRYLKLDRTDRAVEVLDTMLLFAPAEATLWRESGLLQAHLGRIDRAIAALEHYLTLGPPDPLRHQTTALIQQLRSRLN